jgi:hypothetical protein
MLVFFVYDPEELINNPKIIESDLSKDEENYAVKIFIRPKKD